MLRREGAGRCMRAAWDPAGNGAQVSTPCCRDCLYRRLFVLGYPVLGLSKLAKLCWDEDIAGQHQRPALGGQVAAKWRGNALGRRV